MREIPVIWLQGSGCTGCTASAMNASAPDFRKVFVEPIFTDTRLSLRYHAGLMGGAGRIAADALDAAAKAGVGKYVLVMEGAVPAIGGDTADCRERATGLAKDAWAVVALGTCAAYGGVSAAAPNPTGAKGIGATMKDAGVATPLVNVPGCPPHPDWFTTTLSWLLLNGVPKAGDLDAAGRLTCLYGEAVHEHCPRRGDHDAGKFAKTLLDDGCLREAGCKGIEAKADCPLRQWNRGVNWCVRARGPCLGCVEPGFPG